MADRRLVLKMLASTPLWGIGANAGRAQSAPSGAASGGSIRDFLPGAELDAIAAGQSDFDCAPAFRAALARLNGPLHVPSGKYVIGSSIKILTDVTGQSYGPGPWIWGDGIGRTILDNRAADGPMFDIDSNADHTKKFGGVLGSRLEGFTVTSHARKVPTTAIHLRTTYDARLFQLHIIGQGADGIRIPCIDGDLDGSNMISLEQVRVEACGGWGIDTASSPGHNETSFLHLQQVFVQYCGVVGNDAVPKSGGMRHKGQILTLEQCGFTINENVALYVPGEAGLALQVNIANTTFENNHMRHILCSGVSGFTARNIQFYNNDANRASVQCEFDGSTNVVRMVDIDGAVVRATSGNAPLTAFRFTGGNLERNNCRVRNIIWDNFDYAGQTRFDGVPFDYVAAACSLVVADGATLLLKPANGNQVPLRLRGKGSTTGEWIAARLPSKGLYAGNAGLASNTHYHVYLYDNNGAMALDLNTTASAQDAESGYMVMQGDATRYYVGDVSTDAQGRFVAAK